MKNFSRFIFFAIMFLSLHPALGQFHAGVYGGFNSATLSGASPPDWHYMSKIGLAAGAIAEINLTQDVRLSLQPGFLQKGAVIGVDVPGERDPKDSLSINLSYASFPLLVKIIHDNGRVYLSGGVDIGLLQKASYKEIIGDGESLDISEKFDSVDIIAMFGVGFIFPLGRTKLQIELRYSQGLLNISNFESRNPDRYLPPEFKTKGLQMLAGVILPFGKR